MVGKLKLCFRHLTSSYEDESDEDYDEITPEHPDDRIADAGDDSENVHTDWSTVYAADNRVDSEISAQNKVQLYNRKKRLRCNKVSFQEDIIEEPTNIHKVIVELNPAALALEKRLLKEESIESAETEMSDLTSSDNYDNASDTTENVNDNDKSSSDDDEIFTVDNLKRKWSKVKR